MDRGGKVFISVLVLFILLVSISSYFVLATETNTKSYDSSTRTVTIRNGANEIATIKLNTPTVYNVIRGKDRLVAEFTIDNYADGYSNAFNDMEFYDIKNNMNQFSRAFVYKYKTIENFEVPDYETVCKERLSFNGTMEKYDCFQNQTGTHTEQRANWNNFNKELALPGGSITLGIFTDVYPNERVEWVPTLYGVEITEWGIWVDSFNNGLMAYYSLDEPTGTFFNNSVFPWKNNESCSAYGSTFCPISVVGKHGNALYFNGTSWLDSQNDAFTLAEFSGGVTFCSWVNSTDNDGEIFNIGGHIYYRVESYYSSVIMGSVAGGDGVQSTSKLDGKNWAFICITHSGTNPSNSEIYFNGTSEGIKSESIALPPGLGLGIGARALDGGTNLTGMIDEVMLWNRSLSATEIADLYDSGTGTFYVPPDNPPTITLNSPENYANFSANPIAFNCTAQDDKMIQNVSLWINGEVNYTLTDEVDNYTELYISRSLPNGIYDWTCSAYDNTTQMTWAVNRTLNVSVDTIPPQTTIPVITPQNPTTNDNLQCYATLTDDLQPNLIAYWKWYKNGVNYLSGTTEGITNGANSLITTLNAGNTTRGENWTCEVKPFDGYHNGTALNSSIAEIVWGITFNVTDSYSGTGLNNVLISCNQTGFSQLGDTINPYGPYGFALGSYTCEFGRLGYFNDTINFTADVDKTISVQMSEKAYLTVEEHTWLEAIYNCLYSGDCSLYNQLLQINQTLNNLSQTINQDYVLTQALNNCIINGDCTLYNTLMNINETLSNSAILTQATYQCINLGNCTLYNTIMQINNNTINSMQEHTWLEAIYNCVNSSDCTLYNNLYATLIQINQTLVNVWQNIMPTNQSVIIYENITNKQVTASKNLTINYTVNIPIKAGYALGTYLPVRIGFWFLNVSDNRTCFNQGDRPTGVIGPYCQPLITEVIGPMGGQVNFTVTLRPNVSLGNYTLKRIIDIDPNNVWINYGQEAIGTVEVKEDNPSVNTNQQQPSSQQSSGNSGNSVTNVYNTYVTNGNNTTNSPETNSEDKNNKAPSPTGITGGVIGSLLSNSNFVVAIIIMGLVLITSIISKTIIKLKKK